MRSILTLFALAAVCAGLAMADTWTGKLVDAQCYAKEKDAKTCDATSATTAFAVDANGKVFNLDESGNAKVAQAMKNRADRAADAAKSGDAITAKITGTASGEMIKVESVELP